MARAPAVENALILSLLPAGPGHRRLALGVVLLSLAFFFPAALFAKVPLTPVPAFLPFYQSALCITDAITALLLFGQARIAGSRALLVLACGYVFTALITLTHLLTFPAVFSPTGLLGAGLQSTAWLFMFWHGGFPLVVIAYALLKGDARKPVAVSRNSILAGLLAAALAAAGFTLLATAGHDLLPALILENRFTAAQRIVITSEWALPVIVAAVLWLRRPHSVLDLWLMVVMSAWVFDIGLTGVLNAGRYDLGFYVGRVYGLLAGSVVLMVLLFEQTVLYGRLLDANRLDESRLRLAGLIDSAMDAIITVDDSQKVVLFNPAAERMFGYARADVIGQPLDLFIPMRFRDAHGAHVRAFGKTGVTSRRMGALGAISGVRANGEEFSIEASISQLATAKGNFYTVILRDITDRQRAEEELRDSVAQTRKLQRQLTEVEEDERRAIHRELHDRIGQDLATAKLNIDLAKSTAPIAAATGARLEAARDLVQSAIENSRSIMAELRPPGLDDHGLAVALELYAEAVAKRLSISVTVHGSELEQRLPRLAETSLFRIAQEAINNLAKHANARNVDISLHEEAHEVRLTISDDGSGFDASRAPEAGRYGFQIMRERAEAVGARLDVESAPGRGTRIIAILDRTA